jgi:hypothetical protein
MFTATLGEFFEQERALRDGRLRAQGQEAAVSEIGKQLIVRQMETAFLDERLERIKADAAAGRVLPSTSAIIEELDALRTHWEANAGLVVLRSPETDAEQDLLKACRRLKRRLATLLALTSIR